ncbi:MAG: AAA family ATPase [Chloroflexi bacterium]|nr:AAA family ATPase [Chloroflexota bacterium]
MAEERKLVSVLFADIVGSTSLGHDNDPEVVRAVLARYFERVREIAEGHGGSVEKFIGDAVMAVFGVPRLHDDDAERAVRAGLAIRDAIGPLNEEVALHLEARIGISTGEAVAAVAALDERQQFLVTGDVVNVAARLQQQADPGEVVVGSLTEQLTREAIEYSERAPVEAKGKPESVVAFRALRATSQLPEQARGLPQMRARLVGRGRELRLLIDTFERSRDDARAQLFTLLGNAGVGKSRLVGEFLARVGGGPSAHILRGRCLPYGTGVTYWPLLEVLQADLEVSAAQTRIEVLQRLDARLDALISDGAERLAVRSRLLVLLGLSEAPEALPDVAPAHLAAELGWGLARYLEPIAVRTPVGVVIDDLQWAEPAVIEILRGVLEKAADLPIIFVCIGRPDLLERHPTWGTGSPNATLIVLEPLTADETRTLIGRLLDVDDLPEPLRARIAEQAAGNPLFCEEFLRMLIEEGRLIRDGDRWRAAGAGSLDVRVPESIHALIAARLDGLSPDAKQIVGAASVIGEQFELAQLAAITAASDPEIEAELRALVRGGFVVPDRQSGPGTYRFRHILLRDVAYATLPKSERARAHETFGRHLEEAAGDRREELVEILAHHAERALSLSVELRLSGAALADRARRALELALDAGDRAAERENAPALAVFVRTARAVEAATGSLGRTENARLVLLEARGQAVAPNYPVAREQLQRAADLALEAGRPDLAAAAYLSLAGVLIFAAGEEEFDEMDAAVASAVARFHELGDLPGELEARLLGLERLFAAGELTQMLEVGTSLVDAALTGGSRAVAARALRRLAGAAGWLGQTALADAFADQAAEMAGELGLVSTARWVRFTRARLAWTRGRFGEAEQACRELVAEAEEAGDGHLIVSSARLLGETLTEAGRTEEAYGAIRLALDHSVRTGERWNRTELLAQRASCATLRGDLVAAETMLAESDATVRADDLAAIGVYNSTLGQLRAAQGRDEEAEAALRLALHTIRPTEYWWWTTLALDLAEFLVARGRAAEAASLVGEVEAKLAGSDIHLRRAQLERLEAQLAEAPA